MCFLIILTSQEFQTGKQVCSLTLSDSGVSIFFLSPSLLACVSEKIIKKKSFVGTMKANWAFVILRIIKIMEKKVLQFVVLLMNNAILMLPLMDGCIYILLFHSCFCYCKCLKGFEKVIQCKYNADLLFSLFCLSVAVLLSFQQQTMAMESD